MSASAASRSSAVHDPIGGDKAGNWQRWYRENIPIAEQLYLEYTAEE
jgi:hypothetical protein